LTEKKDLQTLGQYFGLDTKTWHWRKKKVGHTRRVTIPQLKKLRNALENDKEHTADDIVKQMGETPPTAAAGALAAATQNRAAAAESAAAESAAAVESAAAENKLSYNVNIEVKLIDDSALPEDEHLKHQFDVFCTEMARRYFDIPRSKPPGYGFEVIQDTSLHIIVDSIIQTQSLKKGHHLQANVNETRRVVALDGENCIVADASVHDSDDSIDIFVPGTYETDDAIKLYLEEHGNLQKEHMDEEQEPVPPQTAFITLEEAKYARVHYLVERKCDVFLIALQMKLKQFGLTEHDNYTVELHMEIFDGDDSVASSQHSSDYEGSFIDDELAEDDWRIRNQGQAIDPILGTGGPEATAAPSDPGSDSSEPQLYPATVRRMSTLRF